MAQAIPLTADLSRRTLRRIKAQSKLVHAQVDDKQLKEDAKNSSRFRGKSGSITYCVGAFLLYLTLTNGQKMVSS